MEQVAQIVYKHHLIEIDKNNNQGTIVVRYNNTLVNVSSNQTLGETFHQLFEGCIFEIQQLRLFYQKGEFTVAEEDQKNNLLGREWASINIPFQAVVG
jgi:hypothetical protein